MDVENLLDIFSHLPRFPDGRINYKHSEVAPVVNVFVKYKDKILLLKRSDKVLTYKGKWNSVGGYIDEPKPLEEKAFEEINEELGIKKEDVKSIKLGKRFEFYDENIGKNWIVFPILVELKNKPEIKLDWEHDDYRWISPDEIKNYDTVPNLDKAWEMVWLG